VEWCRYRQETVCEMNLPLGKRNAILVQSGWCFDLHQVKVNAVKGFERSGYDNVPRTINSGGVDMPILGQVRVGNIKMVPDLGFRKVSYRQHGQWSTFALIDGVPQRATSE